MRKPQIGRFGRVLLIALSLALTFCWWLESSDIQVVENSRKPKAPGAGRVIVPKEVMTIAGNGPNGHYFKYAWRPRVAPDGSLLVRTISQSGDVQILMFDKAGQFVRTLEGPELKGNSGFFLAGKHVVVLAEGNGSFYLTKLLWFNSTGIYEREITLPYEDCTGCWVPLAFFDNTFYFLYHRDRSHYDQGDKPGIVDSPRDIISFKEGSGAYTPLASFPTKNYFLGCKCDEVCNCEFSSISDFMAVPYQGKYLVLSHNREYLLKIYDPVTNTVIREFKRDYKRIKNEPAKVETIVVGKRRTAPHQKYTQDVVNIFARGDEIWAVTSTRDEAKGVLIDIFNGSGIYKDSLYLKLPDLELKALADPTNSTLDGNALYTNSTPISNDDTCIIRKYLIEN